MDIILINGNRGEGVPTFPVGLGFIAEAVERAGFDYEICDTNFQSEQEILTVLVQKKPIYIGLSTMTFDVRKNYDLLEKIKNSLPDCKTVLGGPHAIAAGALIFRECPAVDIVIQGEGEKNLPAILAGDDLCTLPGVMTKDHLTPIPHEFLDLKDIAFPKYHKFQRDHYQNMMPLSSSRGCVYNCFFCGAAKFLGRKWRPFSADHMFAEFSFWYQNGYRDFYFNDSLFALDKQRIFDFCDQVIQSGKSDVTFFADGIRADNITEELLSAMKKAHFTSIAVGVESTNESILQFYQKKEHFSQINTAIRIADKLDFQIFLYFIIGAPEESIADIKNDIRFSEKYLNIRKAYFHKLLPIKGTDYYQYAVEHNLIKDDTVYYPSMERFGGHYDQDTYYTAGEKLWQDVQSLLNRNAAFLDMRTFIVRKLREKNCLWKTSHSSISSSSFTGKPA